MECKRFWQAWDMNISGYRAPIWRTRATFSGCRPEDRSHSPIGMPGNRTTSGMRTARRRTASNYGIVMAKDSNGTIHPAVLRLISFVKCKRIKPIQNWHRWDSFLTFFFCSFGFYNRKTHFPTLSHWIIHKLLLRRRLRRTLFVLKPFFKLLPSLSLLPLHPLILNHHLV